MNTAVSKTLDDRAINMDSLSNPSKIEENFNLCLNSGKSIGCTFPPTTLKSLKDGNEEAIIATIVQFIKVYLRSRFKIMYDGDGFFFPQFLYIFYFFTYVRSINN